jgi:uncharacterized protein
METIINILKNIEATHNVTILYACETGSRSWGFPSPDSDYDIRFIYMHNTDWYLDLNEKKDHIEFIDGDWDLSGWDLRKSLHLLTKSNAALIERFNAPIVYYAKEDFADAFNGIIHNFYSRPSVFYHHYSLAKNFWEDIKDKDSYRLKSMFYLIRSLLTCLYILNNKDVAPMNIFRLLSNDLDFNSRLENLIAYKATKGEKYLHNKDDYFDGFIRRSFEKIEASKNEISNVSTRNWTLLNTFFKDTIKKYDGHSMA